MVGEETVAVVLGPDRRTGPQWFPGLRAGCESEGRDSGGGEKAEVHGFPFVSEDASRLSAL
jgi:hypothetical protein